MSSSRVRPRRKAERLLLEHLSQQLTWYVVAAVGEEAADVPGCDRVQCCAHRLDQGFTGTRCGASQQCLDLREGFLDRALRSGE